MFSVLSSLFLRIKKELKSILFCCVALTSRQSRWNDVGDLVNRLTEIEFSGIKFLEIKFLELVLCYHAIGFELKGFF